MRISFLPFLLILLPLSEIAVFVLVGGQIGVLATIALVLTTAVTGMFLLRHQGLGIVTRIRTEMDRGQPPARELVHGLMIAFAGLLLLTPGFITDTLGLLLFIPALRDRVWNVVRRTVSVVDIGPGRRPGDGPDTGRGPTIDLDPDDYSGGPNPDSPWRDR